MGFHARHVGPHRFQVVFQLGQSLPRRRVGLFFQCLTFDFGLGDFALHLVDFDRHRVDFDAQFGGGLVDQVDGLVRQKTVGHIAVRKPGGGHDGGIADAHAMVHLVFFLESAENRDRVRDSGFGDHDRLKPALQSRIFFDVFAVFIDGGGAHAAQRAPGQGRLEHVGGIHRALGGARAHKGVQFVDKHDHFALGIFDLLEHGLQPVFKFTAVFRARDHGAHVQGDQASVLQAFGNVPGDNALGQSLHDGCFTDARLANQYGVVFGAAREHLHNAANLVIPADDRVEFAQSCQLGQIATEFFERLVFFFGIGVGDALGSTDVHQRFEDRFKSDPVAIQNGVRVAAFFVRDGQKNVLDAHILIFHFGGLGKCIFQHGIGPRRQIDVGRAGDLGQPFKGLLGLTDDSVRRNAHFAQYGVRHPAPVRQHRG